MRRGVVAAAATLAFAGGPPAAGAAGTVTLELFPTQPRAGELATVQVRTFAFLDPPAPAIFPDTSPLSLGALSPSRPKLPIRVRRDPRDPFVWTGTVRFPSRGPWTLCVFNFQSFTATEACSARNPGRLRVQVRARAARVGVWHRLQRPLRIPTVVSGAACPASSVSRDLREIGFVGSGFGPGPAYPVGLGLGETATLRYLDPIPVGSIFYGSEWFGNKTLWVLDEAYGGPVLVRGRQLDGANIVRFDRGNPPLQELRIAPSAPRTYPSFTRVRAAGCYGYQVDGPGFSYVIVFEADAESSAGAVAAVTDR